MYHQIMLQWPKFIEEENFQQITAIYGTPDSLVD